MSFLCNYFIYFYIEKRKTSASGERRKTDERKLLEAIADICANTAKCTTHTSSDEDFSRVKSAMQDIRGKLSQFAQDVANIAKNCILSMETILKYISEKKDSSAKLSHSIYLIKQARQTETDIQRKLTIALNEKTELLKMRDYMKKDIAEMERTICHLKKNLRQAKKNTDKKIDFTFSNRYKRGRPTVHLCSHRGASSVPPSTPSAPDHTDSDTGDKYTDSSDAEYFHSDDHKYIEKPETEILERDDDTMLSPTDLRGGADVAEARPVTVTLPRPSAGRPIKSSRSINPKRLYVDENVIPDPEPLAYTSMIPLGDHKSVTHSIQIKVDLVTPSLIRKLPNINTDHTQTDMHCRSEGDGAETKPVVQVAREKMKKRLFRKK